MASRLSFPISVVEEGEAGRYGEQQIEEEIAEIKRYEVGENWDFPWLSTR